MFLDPMKAFLAAVVLIRVGSNANDGGGDSSTVTEEGSFRAQAKVHGPTQQVHTDPFRPSILIAIFFYRDHSRIVFASASAS